MEVMLVIIGGRVIFLTVRYRFAVKLHTIFKLVNQQTAKFVEQLKYNSDQMCMFSIIPFLIQLELGAYVHCRFQNYLCM